MTYLQAYYAGRNDLFNDEGKRSRKDFDSQENWEAYKRGYRHAAVEERLDADTSWDE